MAYASADDVAARLGRTLSTAETDQVEVLLEDVESLIRSRIPTLDAAVDASSPDSSVVVRVEAWAVVRFMKNPDGKYTESVAGQYSFSRDQALATGQLYLSDEDWEALIPATGSYSTVFEIQLGC